MAVKKLSPQEETAMQAVWKTGEGSIKRFLEHMPETGTPYTTLASTIKNLGKKGFISSRLIGNAYLYKPEISRREYYKGLVKSFVEEKKLCSEDLKDIIDHIEGPAKNPK